MSASSDTSELAPSRDPAVYGRGRLVTTRLVLWLAACLACLTVGAALGRYGVRPAHEAPFPAAPPTPTAAPAAPALAPTPLRPPVSAPLAPSGPDAGLAALSARVTGDEASAARADRAAALALAAASLTAAAEGAGPFAGDLAACERIAPDDPDLRALEPPAARGAPSRAALAAALPDLAASAIAAARAATHGNTLAGRFWALLGRVALVRRIDVSAPGVDGVIARAQAAAAAGDLERALAEVGRLPPAARAPLADWAAAAQRRIEIDRALAALRSRALAALADAAGPSG